MTLDGEFVFIGFNPKRLLNPGWEFADASANVTGCMSAGSDDGEDCGWWDWNRTRFYNTVEKARAACLPGGDPVTVFAYWLSLYRFKDGERLAFDMDEFFPDAGSLPDSPPDLPMLGFDVVAQMHFPESAASSNWCWGCSPLACNGYGGGEFEVNRICLLPTFKEAIRAQRLFQDEQPEPGTYLIVRVHEVEPLKLPA